MKEKKPNPFYRVVKSSKIVQSRNYSESDHLLPEEQWAQITSKFVVADSEEPSSKKVIQYNMYERRLADKLNVLDWKLSYIMDEEDVAFIHAKSEPKVKHENTSSNSSNRANSAKETV